VTALPQELIRKKRDGDCLSADEIRAFINGITDGSIPDYQAAAMLMAVFLRGLDEVETAAWCDAMLHSGDVLDLSAVERPRVDKHSTGGVGDKISLPLAPAAAACGLAVPMVSGRGLGHTGGTLDKLEAIPGFRVDLSVDRFAAQVAELGACLIGQTERMAPADRVLYALRDVTSTVESIPLIASSIMSKKLAEGIDGLVLDCKIGSGAFMKTRADAETLARAIQGIGRAAGKKVTVVLSRMDEPIGDAVGNAVEVAESIAVLRGRGPADTRELTVRLGAEMLLLGDICTDPDEAAKRIRGSLDDGSALAVFRAVVEAQGGDPRVADDPGAVLPKAAGRTPVAATTSGYITACAADEIGIAALVLGAGRRRKEDDVDPAVGIEMACQIGDAIEVGQPLAYLLHSNVGVEEATRRVERAYTIGDERPEPQPLILEVMR
jgi:pyrimidine-nucleoside phosphorylase